MTLTDREIRFSDSDLKELFELFSSCSKYELSRVFDPNDPMYFGRVDLEQEYELTQPKREFALDAARAVLYFLHSRGYKLQRNDETLPLGAIVEYFV
jgi:hypothetical protein